jgi:hypothetical protein
MNDREYIQNGTIPVLLLMVIDLQCSADPKYKSAYKDDIKTLHDELNVLFNSESIEKREKLMKRLDRVANIFFDFYKRNKFDTRKGFILLNMWVFALNKKKAIEFQTDDYVLLLRKLDKTLTEGSREIKDAYPIYKSANKQMYKVHKLFQTHNYWKDIELDKEDDKNKKDDPQSNRPSVVNLITTYRYSKG